MKNNFISDIDYKKNEELLFSDKISINLSSMIYTEYINRCFKAGAMDFDDLLLKTNELSQITRRHYPSTKIYLNIY